MPGACDACGWIAAFGGMLGFGSFGVPIKSPAARSVDIDPLVFQTYKTSMCFLTCWIILLFGEEFRFTPWGIVSGLFWVPGGVTTVYAIKTAGLAIGIGVGSSFIVLVSFTWGIFVFNEHVHSKTGACMAVGSMILGLMGMAYYSAPPPATAEDSSYQGVPTATSTVRSKVPKNSTDETGEFVIGEEDEEGADPDATADPLATTADDSGESDDEPLSRSDSWDPEGDSTDGFVDEASVQTAQAAPSNQARNYEIICGMKIEKRILGILGATFTGVWGGSIMVPMQWCPDEDKGLGYLISFAIGAATVNLALWIFRYSYLVVVHQGPVAAYQALPSFHLKKMWLAGGTSGLLWSIGNFCSLLSVEFLGEGVGYSVIQASMLVSGLWGIFYFGEIKGSETIAKWFMSASLTVLGIVLLSVEHHEE